jgi:hypothetical protein
MNHRDFANDVWNSKQVGGTWTLVRITATNMPKNQLAVLPYPLTSFKPNWPKLT